MMTHKKPEIAIIDPVNQYNPICNYLDPIQKTRQDGILALYDMEEKQRISEEKYSKDYMQMKDVKPLRKTAEEALDEKKEKYRKVLSKVIPNLYDMEWEIR